MGIGNVSSGDVIDLNQMHRLFRIARQNDLTACGNRLATTEMILAHLSRNQIDVCQLGEAAALQPAAHSNTIRDCRFATYAAPMLNRKAKAVAENSLGVSAKV